LAAYSGESHHFNVVSAATPVDHFGFEEAIDSFGERIVIAVADAACRGFDPGRTEPDARQTYLPHQAGNGTRGSIDCLPSELLADRANPVNLEVLSPGSQDLESRSRVPLRPDR
jgi:hypothetical protein